MAKKYLSGEEVHARMKRDAKIKAKIRANDAASLIAGDRARDRVWADTYSAELAKLESEIPNTVHSDKRPDINLPYEKPSMKALRRK